VSENTKDVSEVPEAVIVSDGKESSGWLVFAAMMMFGLGSFVLMAWAILTGRAGGFVLGFIFATLSAARWFLLVPIAPLWSAIMVVLWVLVMYALIKTGDYAL
jgi:hypothetical protein